MTLKTSALLVALSWLVSTVCASGGCGSGASGGPAAAEAGGAGGSAGAARGGGRGERLSFALRHGLHVALGGLSGAAHLSGVRDRRYWQRGLCVHAELQH